MNGYLKLFRGDLVALGSLSDREFRYYIMSLGICVWDRRNQLAGTFDARTDVVKQHMLPKWSTGKINMTKNSLLRRGFYQKTADIRRLKIMDIQKLENTPKKIEKSVHVTEEKFQEDEVSIQKREEWFRRIRATLGQKPSDSAAKS